MQQFLKEGYLDYKLIKSKSDEVLTAFAYPTNIYYPVTAEYILNGKFMK